jgi:hypothetical protein
MKGDHPRQGYAGAGSTLSLTMPRLFSQRSRASFPLRSLIAVVGLTLAVPVAANEPDAGDSEGSEVEVDGARQAARSYDEALKHVDERKYDQAIAGFLTAYRLRPHYAVLYNLGLAYEAAGRKLEAVQTLERFLDIGGTAVASERRDFVKRRIAELATGLASVELKLTPATVEVTVDGDSVRPPRLWLVPGEHVLVFSAPGYATETRQITAVAGSLNSLNIELATRAERASGVPERAHRNVSFELDCPVPDVAVAIDGEPLAVTAGLPRTRVYPVPADASSVTLSRPGYRSQRIEVQGQQSALQAKCELLPEEPVAPAAFIEVEVSEPGATIELDGKPLVAGPLVPGKHALVVRKSGFAPWSGLIEIDAGQTKAVAANLIPMAGAGPPAVDAANGSRSWAYVLAGAGVALGAGAVAIKIHNDSRFDDWEATNSELKASEGTLSPTDQQRLQDNQDLKDSIRVWDAVALGAGIGGVAAFAVGTYLFFDKPDARQQDSLSVNFTGSGLNLTGSF